MWKKQPRDTGPTQQVFHDEGEVDVLHTDGHQQLLEFPWHLTLNALLKGLPTDALILHHSWNTKGTLSAAHTTHITDIGQHARLVEVCLVKKLIYQSKDQPNLGWWTEQRMHWAQSCQKRERMNLTLPQLRNTSVAQDIYELALVRPPLLLPRLIKGLQGDRARRQSKETQAWTSISWNAISMTGHCLKHSQKLRWDPNVKHMTDQLTYFYSKCEGILREHLINYWFRKLPL